MNQTADTQEPATPGVLAVANAGLHVVLCDAVIESEIRREEFGWLKQFEKQVDSAARLFDSAATADAVVEACEWLDKQRSDREGPQE